MPEEETLLESRGDLLDQNHLVLVGGGRDAGVEFRVDHRQSTAEAGRGGRDLEQVAGDDLLNDPGGELRLSRTLVTWLLFCTAHSRLP